MGIRGGIDGHMAMGSAENAHLGNAHGRVRRPEVLDDVAAASWSMRSTNIVRAAAVG